MYSCALILVLFLCLLTRPHRAKRKLIIVGSLDILHRVPVLHDLKRLVEGKGWVVALPCGAVDRSEAYVDV
jgi:hypothetical protein